MLLAYIFVSLLLLVVITGAFWHCVSDGLIEDEPHSRAALLVLLVVIVLGVVSLLDLLR